MDSYENYEMTALKAYFGHDKSAFMDFEDFIKAIIKKTKLYGMLLVGETHGIAVNYTIKQDFILSLVNRYKSVCIFMEVGYEEGKILNTFLKTKEINHLYDYMSRVRNSYLDTEEAFLMWQALADESKGSIEVIGVDSNIHFASTLKALNDIINDKKVDNILIHSLFISLKHLQSEIESGKEIHSDYYRLWYDFGYCLKHFKSDFKKLFPHEYFDFMMLSSNVMTKVKMNFMGIQAKEIRENAIYENIKFVYCHTQFDYFYGQFGNAHISEFSSQIKPFTRRIKEDHLIVNKSELLVLHTFYTNTKSLNLNKRKPISVDLPIALRELIHIHKMHKINGFIIENSNTTFHKSEMGKTVFLESFNKTNFDGFIICNQCKPASIMARLEGKEEAYETYSHQ